MPDTHNVRVVSAALAAAVVLAPVGLPSAGAQESQPGRLLVGFSSAAYQRAPGADAHEEADGEVIGAIDEVRVEVVEVDDVESALTEYRRQPGVRFAEVDDRVRAFSNDPLYTHQWNLQPVSGANKGTANVEPAWGQSRGADVVVAVVDTGVRVGGSDLDSARVLPGTDIVNGDANADDDHGHGTHVAGTVAQSTDNAKGVAGVAPDAKILPVKVLDAGGAGYESDIVTGILWAKDRGADVINLSLGSSEESPAMCQAVGQAVDAGVVVVAATGNDGAGFVGYPAACDGAIGVGAVRMDGALAGYSNRGLEVDLVAPGGDLGVDQNGDGYGDGILQQNYVGSWAYRFLEGTSMAAPHVAGASALLLAVNPSINVAATLTATARDLGAPGWDEASGFGALDAAAAVTRAADGVASGDGYWLAASNGQVRGFGSAPALGSLSGRGVKAALVSIEQTPAGDGYWILDADGGVHGFGAADYHGSLADLRASGAVGGNAVPLDIASTPTGRGYWILDAAGGIFTFGDARFFGSVPGLRNDGVKIGPADVVDIASTPTGRGYWILDDVGGMFAFGDAAFLGSVPGLRNDGHKIGPADIVSMAATASGRGYWLVDDVGGMFAFGDAAFHGSLPGLKEAGVKVGKATVVAMEPTGSGSGYWLVDDAGGIFTFGDAKYHGSLPASGVKAQAVGIAPAGR